MKPSEIKENVLMLHSDNYVEWAKITGDVTSCQYEVDLRNERGAGTVVSLDGNNNVVVKYNYVQGNGEVILPHGLVYEIVTAMRLLNSLGYNRMEGEPRIFREEIKQPIFQRKVEMDAEEDFTSDIGVCSYCSSPGVLTRWGLAGCSKHLAQMNHDADHCADSASNDD